MYLPVEKESSEQPNLDFGSYPSAEPQSEPNDNEFDDFEEDEMTKRIREEEERVQTRLKEKSVFVNLFRKKSGPISNSVKPMDVPNWKTFSIARSRRRKIGQLKTKGRSRSLKRSCVY